MAAEARGDEETLSRHKAILTDFAARRGLPIGQIYQEVVSGETIKDRPQIQRLIADCYRGMWRGIIIVEVTRLSRGNQGDAQTILDCLRYANQNAGVLVITPTKVYDVVHSQEDEEFMEFELFMSRREYKMIQKRLERGKKQSIVDGWYMGSHRPYGYNFTVIGNRRAIVPNEAEAPIVRQIFDLANEGLTAGKIAATLTAQGVPTYGGGKVWSKETVRTILMNPVYIGKVRYNDRMTTKTMHEDGTITTSRPKCTGGEQYMLYDGKHQAIVDERVYTAVNGRFKSDRTRCGLKLKNPLAGLLVCAQCGRAMKYQITHGKGRYYHDYGYGCGMKTIAADKVLGVVVDVLRQNMADFQATLTSTPQDAENAVQRQIDAIRRERSKISGKIERLFELVEDGTITGREFGERKALHEERLTALDAQISKLSNRVPAQVHAKTMVVTLSDALEALEDTSVDAEKKNAFLKKVIERIEYQHDEHGCQIDVFLRS